MDDETRELAVELFDLPEKIPLKAQTIIAMTAFGISRSQIAKQIGWKSKGDVETYLRRYDPTGIARRGDSVRKLLLSGMFGVLAREALRGIKPCDLPDPSKAENEMEKAKLITARVKIARDCARAMAQMNTTPLRMPEEEAKLIESLQRAAMGDMEVIDAEAEVEVESGEGSDLRGSGVGVQRESGEVSEGDGA